MKTQELDLVQAAAKTLGEHFDSVQIIATRHEPTQEGGTIITHAGVGNWYARSGSVRAWITHNDESMREDERQSRQQ